MTENETSNPQTSATDGGNVVALPTPPKQPPHKRAANFVHDHPVLTIAGGLAIGAVAAALIPRRNREFVAQRSSALADAVSAATLALAQQALEKAETAGSTVRHQADVLSGKAENFGHAAMKVIGRAKPEPTFVEKLAARAGDIKDKIHR